MKTPTTALLVVIAALLAANLFVSLPPREAKAQAHPHLGVAEVPQLVDVAVAAAPGHNALVRIWSDGFAEYKVAPPALGWEPQVWTPLPVNPDTPRSRPIAVTESGGASTFPQVFRLWADGTVDHLRLVGDGNMFLFTVEGWITEPK